MWMINGRKPDYSALCRLPLFLGVDQQELATSGQELDFREECFSFGQRIIARGQRVERPLLLLGGRVQMHIPSYSQQNRDTLGKFGPGDLLGLESVFSRYGLSPCDMLVASPQCRCLSFCAQTLRETTSPLGRRMRENCLHMQSDSYIRLLYWLCVLSQRGLREKILTFAQLMCEKSGGNSFQLRMTQAEFAAYLRVARPSLNRELQAMQRDGLLRIEERTYTLLSYSPPLSPLLGTQTDIIDESVNFG